MNGDEFMVKANISELTPRIYFEAENGEDCAETVRCKTVTARPDDDLWLLVTSLDKSTPINPTTLLLCLENLRTVGEASDVLIFFLTDDFRGKFAAKEWLQLIAMVFCRQAKLLVEDTVLH